MIDIWTVLISLLILAVVVVGAVWLAVVVTYKVSLFLAGILRGTNSGGRK